MIMAAISSMKLFLTTKTRLVIEYILIGFVVFLAALVFGLWLEKGIVTEDLEKLNEKTTKLEVSNENLVQANSEQVMAIKDLMVLRKKDADVLDSLSVGVKQIASDSATSRKKLKELEQSNVEVRNFLHSPIPAAIKCLRNKTCADSYNNKNQDSSSKPAPDLNPFMFTTPAEN